jgi:hypothetical protein
MVATSFCPSLPPSPDITMSEKSGPLPSSDVEKAAGDYAHLTNTTVQSFGWENISVTVKDRESKLPKTIVSNVNGIVKAGTVLPVFTLSGQSETDIFEANCLPLWVQGTTSAHLVLGCC